MWVQNVKCLEFVQVTSTERAQAILSLCKGEESFGAIITDLARPGANDAGITLTSMVRAKGWRQIPIVIYTSAGRASDPQVNKKCLSAGATLVCSEIRDFLNQTALSIDPTFKPLTFTRGQVSPPLQGTARCMAPDCCERHPAHTCKICGQCPSKHTSTNCPLIGGLFCAAPGCRVNHPEHYCESCGDSSAQHIAENCPNPKLPPTAARCQASMYCSLSHTAHWCSVCRRNGVDHRSSFCPSGKDLFSCMTWEELVPLVRTHEVPGTLPLFDSKEAARANAGKYRVWLITVRVGPKGKSFAHVCRL
jgi:CheY-like chemotaxis protein